MKTTSNTEFVSFTFSSVAVLQLFHVTAAGTASLELNINSLQCAATNYMCLC